MILGDDAGDIFGCSIRYSNETRPTIPSYSSIDKELDQPKTSLGTGWAGCPGL